MDILEMPKTISNPVLQCPFYIQEEEKRKSSTSNLGQMQKKLMTGLLMLNDEKAFSSNEQKENDWHVLQCSALYPLWDYRKNIRKELGLNDQSQTLANEQKISDEIMKRFYSHLIMQKGQLSPEVIFHVGVHEVQDGDDRVCCVHLRNLQSRKKIGAKVLGFLCEYVPKVLAEEMKQ